MSAPVLIERERLNNEYNTTAHIIKNHQLVYKLYGLTPEEIKIVEGFNEGKGVNPQKGMIGIDQNTANDIFGRDELDLQDATPHRNPVHPVNPVK